MTTTYDTAPALDYEAIRELLNAKPPATMAPEAAAQWMKRRDYWLVELFPEVGPALYEEDAIENDYFDIRRGN
jgi:hypothetical protein